MSGSAEGEGYVGVITIEEVVRLVSRELRGVVSGGMTIDENARLNDLGISSLQIAEIVFTLEDNHKVEFDPARAADARTLGDLIALGNDAVSAKAR
jgi:acyl carrier protein